MNSTTVIVLGLAVVGLYLVATRRATSPQAPTPAQAAPAAPPGLTLSATLNANRIWE